MATAYTPGLTVTGRTLLRRTRRLPLKGDVLVETGQRVLPETVVARAALPGLMQSIKVAAQLNSEPGDLRRVLRVTEGDLVAQGDVLASTQALFGLLKSQVVSPVAGVVETVSTSSGNVGIRLPALPIELTAYVAGAVAEVLPGEGVVIETQGALVQGIFGVGGERVGEIAVAVTDPAQDLTEGELTPDMAGKVVVGGAVVTGGALRRAAELGIIGLVVGGIVDSDLVAFLGYDIGVAITGHENIPFTLILTEGFGPIAMARRTFDLLHSLSGQRASLSGATQIRAGVIRPELIVPAGGPPPPAPSPASQARGRRNELLPSPVLTGEGGILMPGEGLPAFSELAPGAAIRLIRAPYFGLLATVTALPAALHTVESGASVRVLEARLADGTTVTVPRANVELTEGG